MDDITRFRNMNITCKGWTNTHVGWADGIFWFRVRGYGLHFKNWKKVPLMFSEREFVNVGKPILIVGYIIVKVLKP